MIVKLCDAASLPDEGQLKAFRWGDIEICVAKVDGLFAFDNRCPHQNGPFSAGKLNGTSVMCPYHAWCFDIVSGKPEVLGDPWLTTFEVRQYGTEVFVKLPDNPADGRTTPAPAS